MRQLGGKVALLARLLRGALGRRRLCDRRERCGSQGCFCLACRGRERLRPLFTRIPYIPLTGHVARVSKHPAERAAHREMEAIRGRSLHSGCAYKPAVGKGVP